MSLSDAFLLDPFAFEVWVTRRTDGVLGSGTEDDPFDGSTVGPPSISISSITFVGTMATVITAVAHGFLNGNVVQVQGAAGADEWYYNGVFPITYISATQFSYTMNGTPASAAFGQRCCRLDPYIQITIAFAGNTATSTAVGS